MRCKLKDITDLITKGSTPRGEDKYSDSDVVFLRAENITDKIELSNNKKYITNKTHLMDLKRSILAENDILITIAGSLGRTVIVSSNILPANINQAVALIRLKKDQNAKFIYFYLKQKNLINTLIASSAQSVQPNLNLQQIGDIEVELPDNILQEKIGTLLSNFDDKIELNNKINKNLEEQILSYYQKLFIKPNKESSKWSVLELSKVTTNIRDKVGDNNYPVFSAINTGNLQFSEEYFNKQVFSKDISKYIVVDKNDFAYNPARVNIGSIGINDLEVIGCVSPVYVVFRVEKGYHNFFNIYIKSNNFKEEVKTRASGSVRQTLNYEDFAKIQIQYPPKEVIEKFNEFCDPLLLSIKTINTETSKLIELRDTLLPKLMSGEIDVSKIDI